MLEMRVSGPQVWSRVLLVLGAVLGTQAAGAAETPVVEWHKDVQVAWQEAQQQGRPLLVFVTRANCLPCAKMKIGTYTDQAVAAAINDRYVPLVLDGSQPSPLLRDLAVKAFPVTFVISPEAVILNRVDGYVSPQQITARLQLAPVVAQPAVTHPASTHPAATQPAVVPVSMGRAF